MDRRFQEVNHESQENKVQTLSHEPLQKLPIHRISTTDREHTWGRTKTDLGLHPKAQISILPPGKYQRPARFREGVDFFFFSPCLNVSLSSVCASFGVGKGLFDLPVQV